MRRLPVLLLTALSCAVVAAQPPKDAPAVVLVPPPAPQKWCEVKVPRGEQVRLKTPDDKPAKWVLIDRTPGVSGITPADDGKSAVFAANRDGAYKLVVFCDGCEPMLTLVAVGDAPGPNPPNPPGPGPGPQPKDPLREKLTAAFPASPTPADRESAKKLASLYRLAAKLPEKRAGDGYAVTTVGQLAEQVRAAAADLTDDGLPAVRQVVAAELAALLGTEDADLTPARRKAAAALFADLAVILDSF